MSPLLNHFRCDGPIHSAACPKWCHLRPGGATKEVPAREGKATTLTDPYYYQDRTTDRDADAPAGQQQ